MKTNHRILALRTLLEQAAIDVLIITNLLNIRYLTGFTGTAGTLMIASNSRSSDSGLLCTDGRYSEQAAVQTEESGAEVSIAIGNAQRQFDQSRIFAKGSSTLAIEADSTSMTSFNSWSEALEQTIVPSSVKVELLRQFKDDEELDAIRKASQIADAALTRVLPKLILEPTETEFAAELEFQMRMLGAQGPSFETIVASGPNSAMPHARPTDRKIVEGDAVVVDFGAVWDGYHSDCTRTYFLGNSPSRRFKRIYESVKRSQEAGVSAAVLGAAISSIDSTCRESLTTDKLGEFFTHGTGHGVGLEIHEFPFIHGESKLKLLAGDVLTVEPGVYLTGELGIRIEDTVAITPTGIECLTRIDKSPLIS